MFVFDSMVAVRLDTGKFKFFPIPLVAGSYADEIPMEDDAGSGVIDGLSGLYSDFLAYGMH